MKKALVGYGGHAREVMAQMGVNLTCFVDDEYVVYGTRPLSEFDPKEYALMVAVADSRDRFDIVQKLPKETKYFTWVHPTALIMDNNVEIGDYFSAMPGAIVSGNVKIYDLVYMGNNSSIREKLSVHSLTTIGMNSAVVKHIEESGVYVGCPAVKIK